MTPLLLVAFFALQSPSITFPVVDPKAEWIDHLSSGCENPSGNSKIRIVDTNGKYSYGDLQFQMGTWLSFGKPFGATEDNIYDPVLQRKVARSMLDRGLWRHWYNCAGATTKKYGPYPTGMGSEARPS